MKLERIFAISVLGAFFALVLGVTSHISDFVVSNLVGLLCGGLFDHYGHSVISMALYGE